MSSFIESAIVSLLPSSLKSDPFVVAFSEAVEIQLKQAYTEAINLSNLNDIDNLPESLVDFLAYQRHVDFYDYTLPIEIKRKLVKDSTLFHKVKGTPKAVEMLIETVFGEGKVEGWYEYDGEPYHFRVLTSDPSATQERAEAFIRAVNTVKNSRSILDNVVLISTEQTTIYWAGVVQIGSKDTYRQV